ncbi:uncharacterized protein LOC143560008 [Bidens hawaiensis]|uniref:uncharacterized protein LOC143560008 n=1 Tax=Bidens hawaiensis TaxID=980011 RepID=UPI00404AE3C3
MQQQPPPSNTPLNAITADQIQKHLEDNKNLILIILECQNLGRYQECARYQAVLQKNLMYLAAIADAQTPASQQQQQPNPSQVTLTQPNSMPQASSFMQQPGGSGQNSMFLVNSRQAQEQQQQMLQLQQQQQFRAQMGFRGGGQSGLFGMQSGGRSEVAYGGDGRGMFFDGGGFSD